MNNIKMLTKKRTYELVLAQKRTEIKEIERKIDILKNNCDHSIMVTLYKEKINSKTVNLCSECLFCGYKYESYHSLVPFDVRKKLNEAVFIDATNSIIEEVEQMYIKQKQSNKSITDREIAEQIQEMLDSK